MRSLILIVLAAGVLLLAGCLDPNCKGITVQLDVCVDFCEPGDFDWIEDTTGTKGTFCGVCTCAGGAMPANSDVL